MREPVSATIRLLGELNGRFGKIRPFAAVSGGADSMTLLDILFKNLKTDQFPGGSPMRLTVFHFNHRLRGEESDRDERLVREYCSARGLECVVGAADVRAFAEENGLSLEDAARRARYGFFAESMKRLSGTEEVPVLFLAHHRRDQAESVLLHLFRGTGIEGLCGMREIDTDRLAEAVVCRPLLSVSKGEILEYASSEGLAWREDRTNEDSSFRRNRIRNELLPALERDYNPELEEALANTASLLSEDAEIVREHVKKVLEDMLLRSSESMSATQRAAKAGAILKEDFLSLPHGMRTRVLREWIRVLRGNLKDFYRRDCDRILELFSAESSKETSFYGIIFLNDFDRVLALKRSDFAIPAKSCTIPLADASEAVWSAPDGALTVRRMDGPPSDGELVNPSYCFFDGTGIREISIRPSSGKEVFRRFPDGRTRELRRLFNDLRIREPLRSRWPLVVVPEGILWVAGLKRSDLRAIGSRGEAIWRLEWRIR